MIEDRYYVRTWKRRDEPRRWQVADRSSRGAAVSREFLSQKPADAFCERMNADYVRYQEAMWARLQENRAIAQREMES
jgi:hypothetical protein